MTMTAHLFSAFRFDGRHAVAAPVWVRIELQELVVESYERQVLERAPLAQLAFSAAFEHAPRLISLANGVTLELYDQDHGFERELTAAGLPPSFPLRMQRRSFVAVACLGALIGLATLAYFQWIPRLARAAAFAMPTTVETRMGRELLGVLDERLFEPSRLDPERVARIAARFSAAARTTAPGVAYRLEFRRVRQGEGINAFTLPGGVIVMLDGTVTFADELGGDGDDYVVGVLGHELGHAAHKHPTRQLLETLQLGMVGGLVWGDFSSTAATLPVLFARLSNSRAFEEDADDFAVRTLRAAQLSADPLYRFFACLSQSEGGRLGAGLPDFMSTHPATEARLARLRALGADAGSDEAACPRPPERSKRSRSRSQSK